MTWFDHFAELATESLKKQMVLCEAARADGIKLTNRKIEVILSPVLNFYIILGNSAYLHHFL